MKTPIKAVLFEGARCIGSGSDKYKRVNGLYKKTVAEVRNQFGLDIAILVPSNTNYNGEPYKRALQWARGWDHCVAKASDFEIVYRVGPGSQEEKFISENVARGTLPGSIVGNPSAAVREMGPIAVILAMCQPPK